MILCIHQRRRRRNKKITYFDVPVQRSIIDIIAKIIDPSSTVYTDDEYAVYNKLEESKMVHHHKTVSHSDKEYARRGKVHVNNCECIWVIYFKYG